ncbi:stalk domain-containing protein [Paenibacillus chondroitinus]|uniref:Stalk domain-containing protein n=1 Tax=Paenibacillus chondroitinus TaxID=59842 RepID=A0ABU6DCT4_9BACL|nr:MULTISPECIES: stalk domain-containing protein [Paenibacillus]MCY9660486.1 copper amine oxidase N-terminal domain-containing protein [Paenibacillus anseongense]MEB4795097.1 stalk domain-containing protein [Paenibacillus chondroitinus]
MKKLLTVTMILFFITSSVNASSTRGDFEGNPIVGVKTNGSELKVEDVPAINYNGRTMVPIYMLRQLGADVAWDDSSYSVNVSLKNEKTGENNVKETSIKNAYKWLSDTDMQIYMFASKLQQYMDLDQVPNLKDLLDRDYLEITEEYNKSLEYATSIYKQYGGETGINEILASQSKVLESVGQTKELFKIWMTRKNDSQINSSLQMSVFNSIENSQKNIINTNKYVHTTYIQK